MTTVLYIIIVMRALVCPEILEIRARDEHETLETFFQNVDLSLAIETRCF